MSEVGRIKMQEEKFTQCRPYLEYKDGMLYEVLKVGDCGSTIARVVDNRVVEQIRADERERVLKEIKSKIFNIHSQNLYCNKDKCEKDSMGYDCEDCLALYLMDHIKDPKQGGNPD